MIRHSIIRTAVSLLLICFLTLTNSYAQSPVIKISNEIINVNGIEKYVHDVQKKETLYSLSKAYRVTIEDIIKENPVIKREGLKIGMKIFIPKNKEEEQPTVQPVQEQTPKPVEESPNIQTSITLKDYKSHIVKWYEDISDIARKYNVSVESIVSLNKLSGTEIKKRQVLFIPDQEYISNMPALDIFSDTTLQYTMNQKDTLQQDSVFTDSPFNSNQYAYKPYLGKSANATIILPINGNDSLTTNHNFMDFYAGVLLAAEKLKQEGGNVNISLKDQIGGSILETLTERDLSTDVIIGPIKSKEIDTLISYTNRYSIPVVSPMDQNGERLLSVNPFLIQAPSLAKTNPQNIVKQLKNDLDSRPFNIPDTVFVFHEKKGADSLLVNKTIERLIAEDIEFIDYEYSILEGRDVFRVIDSVLLNKRKFNYVIVPSNNQAFVNDIVRNLNLTYISLEQDSIANLYPAIKKNFGIKLYGQPRWINFETIEPEQFHRMNLKISLPYFIDYNSQETTDFLLKFRALFGTEPSPYAFQGYDTAKYFLTLILQYGKEFVFSNALPPAKMLQSSYEFIKDDSFSGFGNNATRNIIYNSDYTISVE